MKSLRILLHLLFLSVNVCCAVLMIVAAYSGKVSPEKSLAVAYAGLAFPLFLAANAFCLMYWLLARSWKSALISAGALLICWTPVRHYIPFHFRTDSLPAGQVIKVLTYNVMNFAGKPHTTQSPNRIIEYITRSEADVVCLQEYVIAKGEGKYGIPEKVVRRALDVYPYYSFIKLHSVHWADMGIAVFSKYPLSKSRRIDYDSRYNGSSIHEVDINGKKLALVNNHFESFKLTEKDLAQYSNIVKSFGPEVLDDIRETFHQKLGPAFKIRAEQVELVAQELKKATADYLVVCGDFNDSPLSYTHRTLQGDDLTDAFIASGRGLGITYNKNFFWFRIDHILHSPNITPYNCTVDNKIKSSDHYPVWTYLHLH
jgi:endonuclease/exonuclease/phosphatase family metal-dependent hydrolase